MGIRIVTSMVVLGGIVLGAGVGAGAPAAPEGAETPEVTDIFETLTANPDLSMFAQAFLTAGIGDRLTEGQEWTVFAPADAGLEGATALDSPEVMANYVVEGAYSESDLWELAEQHGGMATLTTLAGTEITIETFDDALRIGGVARIVGADIETTNGFVHVIDGPIPMAEAKGGWQPRGSGWDRA